MAGRVLARPGRPAWLRGYERGFLAADVLAGAVVTALLVPQALGYAAIAGVPVEVGLYAVPLALLAYALLGSSRTLVVGPASTVAVVSGSVLSGLAVDDVAQAIALTSALAITSGAILLLAGIARVGWLAEFLSKAIVTGFVFGLALTIVVGEVNGLTGIPGSGTSVPHRVAHTLANVADARLATIAVGGAALAVLVIGTRLAPRLPWSMAVVVLGIAAARLGDLAAHGVALVGRVPSGLPTPTLPAFPLADLPVVITGGVLLALVGLAEGLSAARIFALRGGYVVDTDRELVATGVANVAAGLSGGLAVAGSLSKTAAADRAGGRSQVTSLTAAALVVVVLVLLTGVVQDLPRAVLSAVVVHAVWGLMDVAAIRRYAAIRRGDLITALVGLAGVVIVGPFYGLVVAIVVSLLIIVYRSSVVDIDVMGRVPGEKAAWGRVTGHDDRRQYPGVLVVRLDGPVFWANASHVRTLVLEALAAAPGTRAVVLDLESTNQLDTTSVDVLISLVVELRGREVDVYLVRVFHRVREVMRNAGLDELVGHDHMWRSISQGVRAARAAHGLTARATAAGGQQADDDLEEALEGDERIVPDADPPAATAPRNGGKGKRRPRG